MSDKEKKYLEDEQVRKNIDSFKNDREKFLNDSSYRNNLGVYYESNKYDKELYRVDKEKKLNNDEKNVVEKKNISNGDKKEKDTYLWVPVFFSFLLLIMYVICIIYYYFKMGIITELFSPGGSEGGGVAFLGALVMFLPLTLSIMVYLFYAFLGMWLFYSMWFLIKLFIFKNGEECELKALLLIMFVVIVLLGGYFFYSKFVVMK